MKSNILIIGHARHGKDTVAQYLEEMLDLRFESSSVAASRIFLFNALKHKYGYETHEQCFEDRVNHRAEWHDLICEFNKEDKARLAREILKDSQMYVGMRSNVECEVCLEEGLFDIVIGVYNPFLPLEDKTSFDIDIWEKSDFVIWNDGTLEDLRKEVEELVVNIQEAWYS